MNAVRRLLRTMTSTVLLAGVTAAFLWIAFASAALAEKRVALVIGNSAYKHAPALANPKNDAEGVAASLKRLKFEVLEGTDLDKPSMERLLQAFSLKLETADVALVFYAGHGLQVHGRNYLVPIEAKLDREADLVFQAVPLDVIQGLMEQSQRTNIMILDACRDNPLARNLARTMGTRSASIGRGLGEAKAGIGTLIVYATQPGNVALDGDTKNSPFTAALLKHIEAPGLEIRQVLTRVRNDVITATREKQVPWDSSSLRGDFFFAGAAASPETKPPVEAKPSEAKPPAVTDTPPRGPDQETVFWQSIKDSKSAADYKAYLERYPNGTFASLAKLRIAEIEKAAVVTPSAPEKPPSKTPEPQPGPKAQRHSTLEAGTFVLGNAFVVHQGVPSAQACLARCVANPRCKSWYWAHPEAAVLPRTCALQDTVSGRIKNKDITSGEIRTTPAAAPKEPAMPAPKFVPRTPAPGDSAAVLQELMRRAQARASEGGLCAMMPATPELKNAFYAGPAGAEARFRYRHPFQGIEVCGFVRITAVTMEEGKRCALDNFWTCDAGRLCAFARRKWCQIGDGYAPR